jgi:DNA invertase Pin-like site-specific DNA recombinase
MPFMVKVKQAAIYCRISRDRTGQAAGTTRQRKDCTALVDRHGWEVTRVYVDDDTTAYTGEKREEYELLLDAVRAGVVDVIVAWHPDRLTRNMRELEDLVDVLDAADCPVQSCQAGEWDLSTPEGRMRARLLGTVARYESEIKAARLKAMHSDLARSGRWWGGPRPYGYQPDSEGGLVVIEDEARIVHEAAARVLAGEWVGQIASDLNRRGVPTARGARWRVQTLRGLLTSDTIAGRRGDQPAAWPGILDTATWRQLRAIIHDESRARGTVARVALLAGIARCFICEQNLITQRRQNGVRVYVCPALSRGGCGGVQIVAEPLERHVADVLLAELRRPEFLAELAGDDEGRRDNLNARLETVEARRAELADLWATGDLGAADWTAAGRRLDNEETRLQAELAKVPAPIDLDVDAVAEGWDAMTLAEQRAVLGMFVDAVVVHPATRRGPGFDKGRVDPKSDIVWRKA